jgi:hypothetical protein
MLCSDSCLLAFQTAWANCCDTATINGNFIDPWGNTPEAANCGVTICTRSALSDLIFCLGIYGGYTGHEIFGDPNRIDVFGFCIPTFRQAYAACLGYRPSPQPGCTTGLPNGLDRTVAQLDSAIFAMRVRATQQLIDALRAALLASQDRWCTIDAIRAILGTARQGFSAEGRRRIDLVMGAILY